MKIRNPDQPQGPRSSEHARLGIPPASAAGAPPGLAPVLRLAAGFTVLVLATITFYLFAQLFLTHSWAGGWSAIQATLSGPGFWTAVAVGFLAQAVDGALGMAYGVTATSFLLSTGVPPVVATASVHMSEVFTTGFSGLSHLRFGNVNRRLFLSLLVPGIVGAVVGALVVTSVDGALMKPLVSAYLLGIGIYVLAKAVRRIRARAAARRVGSLALVGGFVDSVGGGGWGPVVTTTLLGSGSDPRTTIGSVNFAEFFLTLASAFTFAVLVGPATWPTVAGLVVGGIFAAPFAAVLCRKLSARTLLLVVGVLISGLSLYNLYVSLA